MKETFGQRFTRLRKERNFTQDYIASRVNVSPQAVSKWENDISMPDIALLGELADLLEVSLDELLGRNLEKAVTMIEKADINKMALKIKIISEDGDKININLPIQLIKVCIETGMQLPQINSNDKLSSIDLSQLYSLIEQGVIGELMTIESAEGDKIIIIVE